MEGRREPVQGTERRTDARGRQPQHAGSHSGGPPEHARRKGLSMGRRHAQAESEGSGKVPWAGPEHAGSRRPSSQPGGIRGSGEVE